MLKSQGIQEYASLSTFVLMEIQSKQTLRSVAPYLQGSVSRVSIANLTSETFFERYQKPGQPVILTDLLEADCAATWNLEYLCQHLNNHKFLLRRYGKDRYSQDKREWTDIGSGVATEYRTFAEYAAMVRSRESFEQDIYLGKCAINHTPLYETDTIGLIQQKLQGLGLTKPISPFNIWVGPAGHNECLHYDPMDGTLIQLYGTKKIILFPPSQTGNLYPFPIYTHLFHGMKLRTWFSQLYPENLDFDAFPRFKEALKDKKEIILHPREALYIPTGWWHEVTALGDEMVCSINRFWRVYPTKRAVFTWCRWRSHLGSLCALPYLVLSFLTAMFSKNR